MLYRKWSHTTYDARRHLVWITKYRRKVLDENVVRILKGILEEVCEEKHVKILKMGFEEDHVHMYIAVPLAQNIPNLVQGLKWRSSRILRQEFKEYLSKYYRKPVLWARWYFICTVWEVNHEIIKKYVEEQWELESN